MTMNNDRHRYTITLEAGKTATEEQATRALRGLLKTALRVFGFRCTIAEPHKTQTVTQVCNVTDDTNA
jgi:hypothetical protein